MQEKVRTPKGKKKVFGLFLLQQKIYKYTRAQMDESVNRLLIN